MVHELIQWTETAARNIKICASSREDNAFTNGFSPEKRLRLQDLTRRDMAMFIHDRLEFQLRSHELSPYEKQDLVISIITKADGIFLWVALVVRRLREMAENWASFSQLETEIGSLPEGLEELFVHIFDSLKRSDQRIAYQTFAIILRWDELETWRQHEMHENRHILDFLSIPLSAYYFIDKHPLELGYHYTFPITKPSGQFSESDVSDQAHRLLMGTCKGLVEAKPETMISLNSSNRDAQVLSFTHRSVPEFLKSRRDQMNQMLTDFSPDKAVCQLLLAYLESGLFRIRHRSGYIILSYLTQFVLSIRHHFQIPASPFNFEERWNAALIELGVTDPPSEGRRFGFSYDLGVLIRVARNLNGYGEHEIVSPLYIAAYLAYSEYVKWKIESNPTVIQSHFKRTLLFWCSLQSKKKVHEVLSIIDVLLEHGLHSSVSGNTYGYEIIPTRKSSMTNWHTFMLTFLVHKWDKHRYTLFWAVMQRFLEVGADPFFWLTVKPEQNNWLFEFYVGLEKQHLETFSTSKGVKTTLLLDLSGTRNNQTMSFREIIEASSHEKKQEILQLIDRNMQRLGLDEKAEQSSRRLSGVLYTGLQWKWTIIYLIGKSTNQCSVTGSCLFIIGAVCAFMAFYMLFT